MCGGELDTSEGRRLRKRSDPPPKVVEEKKKATPKRNTRVWSMFSLLKFCSRIDTSFIILLFRSPMLVWMPCDVGVTDVQRIRRCLLSLTKLIVQCSLANRAITLAIQAFKRH